MQITRIIGRRSHGRAAAARPRLANGKRKQVKMPSVVAIEGDVPTKVAGHVAVAIGVSGASSEQDGEVAAVALAALQRR
ncbi:MAG TPA: heme-binding protein [Allosphingosinicella sp.]|jgi:uncharacterized protein GlcG (DUF336 family)